MVELDPSKTLVIAGGHSDPNLGQLVATAQQVGVVVQDLRHGVQESPSLSWHINQGSLKVNDQQIKPYGAFIRYDVFAGMEDSRPQVAQRAMGWYQTLQGWLLSEPNIRLFNRHQSPMGGNKGASLVLAQQCGLAIPETLITNQETPLRQYPQGTAIAKPVAGGDYCYGLEELLNGVEFRSGCAANPAIVQNRLVAPEIRIYIIGNQALAFEMRSNSLDYRVKQDAEVIFLSQVPPEVESLRVLMAKLNMDFGAADFKSDPKTGKLIFLELNTSPMFARFNQVSQGALCRAMLNTLLSMEGND
ncbi:MAG: hypothetical protein AB4063_10595 [Crocosphaera sp.]